MSELIEIASGLSFPKVRSPCPTARWSSSRCSGRGSRACSPTARRRRSPRSRAARTAPPSGPTACSTCATTAALHRDRPRRATFPGGVHPANYIGGRIQTVDPAPATVDRPLHRVRRQAAAGARTTSSSTPTAASTSPTTASSTTRSASHQTPGSTTPRPTARRSRRSSSRPTSRTASACRPTAPSCTGPRRGTGRIMQRDIVAPGQARRARPRRHVAVPVRLPRLPAARLAGGRRRAATCASATIVNGGVSVVSPAGELVDFVETGDLLDHQHLLRRRRSDARPTSRCRRPVGW